MVSPALGATGCNQLKFNYAYNPSCSKTSKKLSASHTDSNLWACFFQLLMYLTYQLFINSFIPISVNCLLFLQRYSLTAYLCTCQCRRTRHLHIYFHLSISAPEIQFYKLSSHDMLILLFSVLAHTFFPKLLPSNFFII